jgi:hypothetical protein
MYRNRCCEALLQCCCVAMLRVLCVCLDWIMEVEHTYTFQAGRGGFPADQTSTDQGAVPSFQFQFQAGRVSFLAAQTTQHSSH